MRQEFGRLVRQPEWVSDQSILLRSTLLAAEAVCGIASYERPEMMTARALLALQHQADAASPIPGEELTWDSCPVCGSLAAMSRDRGGVTVECTNSCPLTPALIAVLASATE